MAIALGKLKLSLSDFYELTPVELLRIYEKFKEDRMDFFESIQIANIWDLVKYFQGRSSNQYLKRRASTGQKGFIGRKMKDLADIQKKLGVFNKWQTWKRN